MTNNLNISVTAGLNKPKSIETINQDIKKIEGQIKKLKLQATLDKGKSTAEIQKQIKVLNEQKRNLYVDLKLRKKDLKSQYKQAIVSIQAQPLNVDVNTATAQNQMSGLTNSVRATTSETVTLASSLKKALTNSGLVISSQTALQLVRKAAQEATAAVKEYDDMSKNLQIITGQSKESVREMMSDLADKSLDYKVDISDLEKAQETLLRTGKSVEDVNYLMKDTVMLAKTGFMDTDDAAESLVTIANAYKYEADEMENVISKFLALDTASNTVAGKLSSAIAKTASNAQMAGVSIDELGGYISELKNTTGKSENEIATALNAMFSRVGNVKLGKYEIELEDGTSEDITQSLNDTERMLKNVGIQLRSSKGEFKDVDDILQEVSEHWKDFNSVEKNSIAKTFSGTQHRNTFISLVENYDKAMQLAEVSVDSAGTATEKYEAYMESLEAKSAALSTSMKELWNDLVPNNLAGDMTDATTSVVQFIDKYEILQTAIKSAAFYALAKGVIATKNSFTGMVTDIKNVSTAMNLATQSGTMTMERMNSLAVAVKGLTDKQLMLVLSSSNLSEAQMIELLRLNGVTEAEARQKLATLGIVQANTTATASTISLRGSMKALWATIAANPIGLIITAFSLASTAVAGYKQHQQELIDQAKESADKLKTQAKEMDDFVSHYESIIDSEKTETEKVAELNEWKQTLADTYGITKDKLADLNLEREEGIKLLEEEIKLAKVKQQRDWLEDNKKAINKAKNKLEYNQSFNNDGYTYADGFDYWTGKDNSISDEIKNLFDRVEKIDDLTVDFKINTSNAIEEYERLDSIATQIRNISLKRDLTESEQLLFDDISSQVNYLRNFLKDNADLVDVYNQSIASQAIINLEDYKITDESYKNLGKENYLAWRDGLLATAEGDKQLENELLALAEKQFPDYAEYFNNLDLAKSMFGVGSNINNGFDAGKKKFLEELSDEDLKIAVNIPDLFADGLDGASKKIQEFKADPNNNPVPEEEAEISLDDFVKKLTDKTKLIKSAMEELRDSGNISASTYAEIVEMGGNFADCLEVQNGKLILNIEKLKELEEQELRNKIAETRLSKASWETVMATHAMAGEDTSAIAEKIRELSKQEAVFNQAIDEITNAKPDDKKDKDLWKEEFDNLNAAWLHDVAMKKKTQDEYINWLDGAYKHYFSDLSKYATEYYKYEEEVFNHNRDLVKKSHEDVLDSIDKQIDELEKKIDREDFGENNSLDNIHNITGAYEQEIDLFKKAVSEIDKQIDEIKKSGLVDVGDELDELFKKREDYLDKIYNAEKSSNKVKEEFHKTAIESETSYWEDLKSKQEDIYDKEIDKLEKVKDAISKKNEEEEKATDLAEKQLTLEKAKLELEKARQNRSVMLVTKQGTFYTADQLAIDEAEKNVKDAEKDIADAKKDDATDKISEQIDVLKEQKENTQNYYDTIIKLLEDSQNDPLQAEANRDLWGKILATENGQNAIASADQDQVNKLIENGFLALNDGKYSLNNPNAEVPKDSQTIDTTDIKNVLTTLFGKKEGYTPERIDSIAEKFELYKHRLYGGTAPSDVVNKATENVSKTINNSQVINKVQNMNTTYHIDKVEVGYSGNDFEGLLADTLDSISQQIIIDGNKALHGR